MSATPDEGTGTLQTPDRTGTKGPPQGPQWPVNDEEFPTEDHKPVDQIFIEKLYRLLTTPLYTSWTGPGEGRPFLVLANVGWFYKEKTPPVAPDCMLSLDVSCPKNVHTR